ncbi:small ribosomal subunit biogenesis GTPase RsgA [Chlorogloeopsis sp. ULAP01]|uniref:small ribosomal subunit biogenesis GTPase RsgA n=1 Tax=Chlorogloeopsis sp. ULAP01 TaxID=3056483 RepID=UPI0025AA489A|nr:small ribosomal subunit biogenesis GTPase RsgA [Chlorogloeopsis sp. ULAP01]MDM9385077.1 small ribosomal subunit biogenesis GTPase RsgA [Chlorogloeopsis sp. ULAP01]
MTAEALANTQQLLGTVLAVQANYYRVQLDLEVEEWERRTKGVEGTEEVMGVNSSPPSLSPPIPPSPHLPLLLCTRRTRLKKIGQQVMVGDRVVVEEPDWAGGRGAIAEVLPRKNQLARPAIANVDQILLVFAVADPPLEPYQLSRFLIQAESTGLHVVLCLNKSDLITSEQQAEINQYLNLWGYQPIFISVYEGINIDNLAESLKQQTTVLAGPSGVGKSSLINALIPNVNLRVGEISGKLARGRHTTRHVELFELPKGGLLADTPGFNQPDLDCTPEELASYFPEIRQRLAVASCRFSDCLHRNEPGCVVQGNWERYQHYLEFLEEAIARQTQLNQQADPESTVKAKTTKQGHTQYEPKLETKKYRRASRRTQLQELEQLYEDSEE